MLKKEFRKKDINRARNLITGNTGASTGIQIGYKKKQVEYKEGDIWTENKKTWTIKNGIKQTVSKLDAIKKEVFMPLCCPKCSGVMKKTIDTPHYKVHKMCHKCIINFEHKLKIKGKYEEYIEELELRNKLTILDQTEAYLLDVVNTSNSGYVSEDGVVEKWVGGVDSKKWTKDITKYVSKTREKFEKELNDTKGA